MGFLALVNAYGMRVSLSITITEMVRPINKTEDDSNSHHFCPDFDNKQVPANVTFDDSKFPWSEYQQVSLIFLFSYLLAS